MALKDKKTKLTFHSGVLTIGGTVIEIRYENSRIFFDFGAEYKPELDLKDESLQEFKLVSKIYFNEKLEKEYRIEDIY